MYKFIFRCDVVHNKAGDEDGEELMKIDLRVNSICNF